MKLLHLSIVTLTQVIVLMQLAIFTAAFILIVIILGNLRVNNVEMAIADFTADNGVFHQVNGIIE